MKYKISLISRHLSDTMNLTGAGSFWVSTDFICGSGSGRSRTDTKQDGYETAGHILIYGGRNGIGRRNPWIKVKKDNRKRQEHESD